MKIRIRQPYSFSEIGRKENQEDSIYPITLGTEQQVFVLCDGMGGHENGEVASQTVSMCLGQYMEKILRGKKDITAQDFNEALSFAYDTLDTKDTGGAKKMGTTMTCLCLHEGGYLVAHIGDSRIYHIRPSLANIDKGRYGIIYQSSDHSLVNDLLKAGELTEEEARNFPHKNVITRAMQPNLERRHRADVYSFDDIQSGDYFFLCCDGILEQLTNETLCSILSDKSLDDYGKLTAIKNICDGKTKDNYTCILIPIDSVVRKNNHTVSTNDDLIVGVTIETEEGHNVTEVPAMQPIVAAPQKEIANILLDKNKSLTIRIVLGVLSVCICLVCGWLYKSCSSEKETDNDDFIELVKQKFDGQAEKETEIIPKADCEPDVTVEDSIAEEQANKKETADTTQEDTSRLLPAKIIESIKKDSEENKFTEKV